MSPRSAPEHSLNVPLHILRSAPALAHPKRNTMPRRPKIQIPLAMVIYSLAQVMRLEAVVWF